MKELGYVGGDPDGLHIGTRDGYICFWQGGDYFDDVTNLVYCRPGFVGELIQVLQRFQEEQHQHGETLRQRGYTSCTHPAERIIPLTVRNRLVQCRTCGAELQDGQWVGGSIDYRGEFPEGEERDG